MSKTLEFFFPKTAPVFQSLLDGARDPHSHGGSTITERETNTIKERLELHLKDEIARSHDLLTNLFPNHTAASLVRAAREMAFKEAGIQQITATAAFDQALRNLTHGVSAAQSEADELLAAFAAGVEGALAVPDNRQALAYVVSLAEAHAGNAEASRLVPSTRNAIDRLLEPLGGAASSEAGTWTEKLRAARALLGD